MGGFLRMLRTRVISRSMLAGAGCHGPAIVQEYDTTVVVPPDWTAALDDCGNILLERIKAADMQEHAC